MSISPRIAIVGMGGLFPSSATTERLWADVLAGADRSCDAPPGRWLLDPDDIFDPTIGAPDKVYSRRGYFLDDVPLDASPALAGLDPVVHLTMFAGRQAFASGATNGLDRRRVGVILGDIVLPTEKASILARNVLGRTFAEKVFGEAPAPETVDPRDRRAVGLPAALLAAELGLGGVHYTLDAACASSLYAIKLAADELLAGRADAMLAGGVSRPDCLYTQMGFSQLRALSPGGRCSPFDARADGLVVGEGAGVFLLKRLEDAVRDGDRILAVIAGVGLSNDVGGGLLAPNSDGQLRAMRSAYADAGWAPTDVDLIECHATGTPVGDAVEFASLKALWGRDGWRPGQCVIGSVKSTVGHLLTAAGASGLAKVLCALRERTLPPTANFSTPPPGLEMEASPFQVLKAPREWRRRSEATPRRAAISGFGFGGVNAHVLLEEYDESTPTRSASEGKGSEPSPSLALRVGVDAFAHCRRGDGRAFRPLGFPAVVSGAHAGRQGGRAAAAATRLGRPRKRLGGARGTGRPLIRRLLRRGTVRRRRPLPHPAARVAGGVAATGADVAGRRRRPGEVKLADQTRPRTGVFIGLGLDLNTTNFHFRWWVLKHAEEWAERLGLAPSSPEYAAWKRELIEATGPPLNANRVMGALGSIAASRIARAFHLGGPSFTLSSGDTSGLRAVAAAVRALQRGELDAALAGAVDLPGDVRALLAARAKRRTAGEGAAAVVLKRLDDAVRDGDTVYAVVKDVGRRGVSGDTGERRR